MEKATSVKKGWVALGLVVLLSGLASFQITDSPAYAQTMTNGTSNTSSLTDFPSNPLQSQLESGQDSLIATPGLSSDDLNPSTQQDSSPSDGDEKGEQQTPTPNAATSSENVADEQGTTTGETVENSIVQDGLPQSRDIYRQPGVGEQFNQPSTGSNDDQGNTEDVEERDQQSDEKGDEGTDSKNNNDEDEDEDEDENEDHHDLNDDTISDRIPLGLPLPFP